MAKIKTLLLLVFVSTNGLLFGQLKNTGYKFHSINSFALVNGSNAVSASIQSVNGFQRSSWFIGIGTGIDYYLYRSIPLFADFRFQPGKKKNNFFAYADGGINFSWVENNFSSNPIIFDDPAGNFSYGNGFYTDAGFGYMVGMKKGNALVLSIGHSHKSLEEKNRYQEWRSQEWFTTRNTFHLNRMMLKVGWRF